MQVGSIWVRKNMPNKKMKILKNFILNERNVIFYEEEHILKGGETILLTHILEPEMVEKYFIPENEYFNEI